MDAENKLPIEHSITTTLIIYGKRFLFLLSVAFINFILIGYVLPITTFPIFSLIVEISLLLGSLIALLLYHTEKREIISESAPKVLHKTDKSSQKSTSRTEIISPKNIEKRAQQFAILASIGRVASSIINLENLLQSVADLAKKEFNLKSADIYLINESGDGLELASSTEETGKEKMVWGYTVPLDNEKSLAARAARTKENALINTEPLSPDAHSEMAIPMIVRDSVIGVIDLKADILNRFTADDIHIQTLLAEQISLSIENARLFESAHRQAEHESVISDISAKIGSVTALQSILQTTARELVELYKKDLQAKIEIESKKTK